MSNGAQPASGVAIYRTIRELGSRSPRSYAAIREPKEVVVLHRFARALSPKAKKASQTSIVADETAMSVSPEAMTTLARDAGCLAMNWHPNIARVRHVEPKEELLTIATDLVDGATLADLLEAATRARVDAGGGASTEPLLPLPIVIRILVDVLAGLQGLHGLRDVTHGPLRMIHGALCPTNIVVGKDGVARLVNALRPRPVRCVAEGEIGYAAPEALDLDGTRDPRSDIHSVGVLLWEALSDRRLYDETDPACLLARQRSEEVERPVFPAGSPFTRLADIAMRAIAFDPSLRFKTASEMTTALRSVAGTRIATGSIVAARVAELVGDRIRARRIELDPTASGPRLRASERSLPKAAPAPSPPADTGGRDTLPPGSMDSDADAFDAPPESERADISLRDIVAVAPPAPRPPPPLVRKAPTAPTAVPVSAPTAPTASPAPPFAAPTGTAPGLGPAPAHAPAPASSPTLKAAPALPSSSAKMRAAPLPASSAKLKAAPAIPAPAVRAIPAPAIPAPAIPAIEPPMISEPELPIAEPPLPERLPIASLQPPPTAVDDPLAPIALTHRLVLPHPAPPAPPTPPVEIATPPQAPDRIASPDVAGLVLTVPLASARPVAPPMQSAPSRVEPADVAPLPEPSPHDALIEENEEAPERRRGWSPLFAAAAIILLVTGSVFAVRAIMAPVPATVAKSGVWRAAAPSAAGAAGAATATAESTAATTETPTPTSSATTAVDPGPGKANEDPNAKNPAAPGANDSTNPAPATAPPPPAAGGPPAQPQTKPKKPVYEPLGI